MLWLLFILKFFSSWNMLSLEKAHSNVYRLQKRIFKSVIVGDIKKCLQIQKLLISSNSACLLAIRFVSNENIKTSSMIDNKTSLNLVEKFEIVKFIKKNAYNWKPQSIKKMFFLTANSLSYEKNVFTFADRSWQAVIKLALEPAHEAIFSPRTLGFRNKYSVYDVQKLLFLNLNKISYGFQKRVLIIEFLEPYTFSDYNILLRKLLIPRSIKLGIFRFLKLGFLVSFNCDISEFSSNLQILLANILFSGIETISNGILYNSSLIILLNPFDNEYVILKKLNEFLNLLGLYNLRKTFKISSVNDGFDFLNWNFKVCKNLNLYCAPTITSYRSFLKRIKIVINNSNYGSNVKVLKVAPLVKEWKVYNQFCNCRDFKTSLFYLQKKAFKIFNKESKNDRYSTKKLVTKTFNNIDYSVLTKNSLNNKFFLYRIHILFWFDYTLSRPFLPGRLYKRSFCIHCGLNISKFS